MSLPVTGRAGGSAPSPSLEELATVQAPAARTVASARTASTPASNTLSAAPALASGANAPREVPTGRLDYYRQREQDFRARNPGLPPPPYYLDYGDKYARAFSALGPEQLSSAGLAWRDRTLELLQVEMEKARREKGADFAQLERDPQAFKVFAYQTHVTAYLDGGLLSLPTQDLMTIVTTPDLQDLLNPEGLEQVLAVMARVRPESVAAIARATTSRVRQSLEDKVGDLEREARAFMQQRWWEGARP